LKQYNKAKEKFKKAIFLDEMNVKAVVTFESLEKIEVAPEISIIPEKSLE